MKKNFEHETMSDNELDEVVGGSYSELEKDLKLFKRLLHKSFAERNKR